MPGEPDINAEIGVSDNPVPGKVVPAVVLRIKFLKSEISRTLIQNHNGGRDQLDFLLKRL